MLNLEFVSLSYRDLSHLLGKTLSKGSFLLKGQLSALFELPVPTGQIVYSNVCCFVLQERMRSIPFLVLQAVFRSNETVKKKKTRRGCSLRMDTQVSFFHWTS